MGDFVEDMELPEVSLEGYELYPTRADDAVVPDMNFDADAVFDLAEADVAAEADVLGAECGSAVSVASDRSDGAVDQVVPGMEDQVVPGGGGAGDDRLLESAERKVRRGVKLTRKERRALENKMFPKEVLGDLHGTTSIDVRRMTEEERKLVYFKRKLRNRESAKRSRMKRQQAQRDAGRRRA